MSDLLPCPLCGSSEAFSVRERYPAADQLSTGEPFSFGCDICGAETGTHATPELAEAAWNRRASLSPRPVEMQVEAVARAIYDALPNYGMEWQPNTAGGYSQVRVDDTWEQAPDRHEDCRRQARAALQAAVPVVQEPVWQGPGSTPHEYQPDTSQYGGDCAICGHTYAAHPPERKG